MYIFTFITAIAVLVMKRPCDSADCVVSTCSYSIKQE